MSESLDVRRRRAVFRANHRGTKEMDWMLGRFADRVISTMEDPKLADFELLLTVADPEIHAWLMDPATCNHSRYHGLVGEIRAFHNLGDVV